MTADITSARFGPGQKLTPQQVLAKSMSELDETETVVVVTLYKDGEIKCGYSFQDQAQVLGLLRAAEHQILHKMMEQP